MDHITEADRTAARALREVLGDISGFWHRVDDLSPLCQALAQHRIAAQQDIMRHLMPAMTMSGGPPSSGLRAKMAGNCNTSDDAGGQAVRSQPALS